MANAFFLTIGQKISIFYNVLEQNTTGRSAWLRVAEMVCSEAVGIIFRAKFFLPPGPQTWGVRQVPCLPSLKHTTVYNPDNDVI